MTTLFVCSTVIILLALVALIDALLQKHWGIRYTFSTAILLLLATLSGLYQIAFIFHLPFLFHCIDAVSLLFVFLFTKTILRQWRSYLSYFNGPYWPLYPFLAYLLFLSIFSVQGWDWDSMIFHLSRPFLYLNEKTIFTLNYSDPRQVVWPVGGDILFYLFTRWGETLGTGFISFLCYVGFLVSVYQTALFQTNRNRALTLLWIAASIPILVYGSTTVKGDVAGIFVFLMTWLYFKEFHETRNRIYFYLTLLALAFGASLKMTSVIAGVFSVIAFFVIEIIERHPWKLTGPKLSRIFLFSGILVCLLFSQSHLYLFNYLTSGHFLGSTLGLLSPMTPIDIFRNFFKYQLELFDFVLPLSSIGIPFIDTLLSFLYNHTIGWITQDISWTFHYFPQEMNASYGPFGILLLWGVYRSAFGKSQKFYRIFAFIALATLFIIVFKFPREEAVSNVRYFAPAFLAGLVLLPTIYKSKTLEYQRTIRSLCFILLVVTNIINYAKPLIAYNPKAIPWHRYAFTNRDFLYKEKHFFDDRINIYSQNVYPNDKVLILSKPNVWMYPYYQYANQAHIQLKNYQTLSPNWLRENLKDYTFIICEHPDCIAELDSYHELKKIWGSKQNLPRPASYYRLTY